MGAANAMIDSSAQCAVRIVSTAAAAAPAATKAATAAIMSHATCC